MEFPKWIPNWVKEEFEQCFVEGDDGPFGLDNEHAREITIQMIQSEEARPAWESFDKYPHLQFRLCELSSIVWSAIWGFGHVSNKRSDRTRIAQDVRKHAEGISQALAGITEQDGFAISSILAGFIRSKVNDAIAIEVELFHRIYNDDTASSDFVPIEAINRAMPAITQTAASYVCHALFADIDGHLQGGLCEALDEWAKRELQVTKPDHPNAKRLYFIRSLTDAFVGIFGRPMRRETLALASVFFDCEGLDEAAISRLAPVRKPA